MSNANRHMAIIHENVDYGTPLFLFKEACEKFNVNPKIDYFASNVNHVCDRYYTKNDDAFTKSWNEDGFINPPYTRKLIPKIMKRAYEEHLRNNITLLILTYNKTDTKWWHEYVENKAEVHFHRGRLSFKNKRGFLTKNKAPYPSVWIIYRGRKTNGSFL